MRKKIIQIMCTSLFVSVGLGYIINVKKLPILVNLDETQDKEFLSSYNKSPYIFLKKQKNGDYNACKYQNGALQCEKK